MLRQHACLCSHVCRLFLSRLYSPRSIVLCVTCPCSYVCPCSKPWSCMLVVVVCTCFIMFDRKVMELGLQIFHTLIHFSSKTQRPDHTCKALQDFLAISTPAWVSTLQQHRLLHCHVSRPAALTMPGPDATVVTHTCLEGGSCVLSRSPLASRSPADACSRPPPPLRLYFQAVVLPDPPMYGPGNVCVSKVVGSVWSYDRQLLCSPFEALCSLDGNALAPNYNCQVRSPSLSPPVSISSS